MERKSEFYFKGNGKSFWNTLKWNWNDIHGKDEVIICYLTFATTFCWKMRSLVLYKYIIMKISQKRKAISGSQGFQGAG